MLWQSRRNHLPKGRQSFEVPCPPPPDNVLSSKLDWSHLRRGVQPEHEGLLLARLPLGSKHLEVHGAVCQVVLAPNVADLLGLHGFQLGADCDAMAQAPTEGTAPLFWKRKSTASAKVPVLSLGRGEKRGQRKLRNREVSLHAIIVWAPCISLPGSVKFNLETLTTCNIHLDLLPARQLVLCAFHS